MKFSLADYDKLMASKPLMSIMLNTTNECNFGCPYCFTTKNPERMTIDTAKAIIEWGIKNHNRELGVLHLNWFGGEPTLEYERLIKPVMQWADVKGYEVDWGLTTNCSLLTEEMLSFFESHKLGILCSIDGTPEVQNKNRPLKDGRPSWPVIQKNFDKLIRYPYLCGFRPTVTPTSGVALFDAYAMARQNGFNMFFPGLDYGNEDWTEKDKLKTEEELFYIGMNIYDDIANGKYPMEVPPIIDALNSIVKGNYNNPIDINRCGLGTVSVGAATDGTIFACQEHNTYKDEDIFEIGNVFEGIKREKHYALIIKYLEEAEVPMAERYERCKTCLISNHCYSDNCPSTSYRKYQTFGAGSEIWCWWNQTLLAIAQLMLLRAEMEKDSRLLEYLVEYLNLPVNVKDMFGGR